MFFVNILISINMLSSHKNEGFFTNMVAFLLVRGFVINVISFFANMGVSH